MVLLYQLMVFPLSGRAEIVTGPSPHLELFIATGSDGLGLICAVTGMRLDEIQPVSGSLALT